MKIPKIILVITLPLILLAWIWFSRVPPSAQVPASIAAPREDFLAPLFTLETFRGGEIDIADLKGQPLILNFWASWCPPCRAEMPDFQQAWEEYRDSGLVIIGVNATYQDSLNEMQSFIASNQLTFPILLDTRGSVSSLYQVRSLPTTFFINSEGVITKTIIGGPIPLSLLRVEADQLLMDNYHAPDP